MQLLAKFNIAIIVIFLGLMLTGCGVDRLQIKVSDIEYETTDSGFIIKSHNYTDVIINQEIQAKVAPKPVQLNSNESIVSQMITNVSKDLQVSTNVSNNTINIKVLG